MVELEKKGNNKDKRRGKERKWGIIVREQPHVKERKR